jgi:hypothetical protein
VVETSPIVGVWCASKAHAIIRVAKRKSATRSAPRRSPCPRLSALHASAEPTTNAPKNIVSSRPKPILSPAAPAGCGGGCMAGLRHGPTISK